MVPRNLSGGEEAREEHVPLNALTRFGYGLLTQDYTADVNILLGQRLWDPRKLLSLLSEEDTRSLLEAGQRATWPKIEMIRNCTLVGRTLDRVRSELEARRGGIAVRETG